MVRYRTTDQFTRCCLCTQSLWVLYVVQVYSPPLPRHGDSAPTNVDCPAILPGLLHRFVHIGSISQTSSWEAVCCSSLPFSVHFVCSIFIIGLTLSWLYSSFPPNRSLQQHFSSLPITSCGMFHATGLHVYV